MFIFLHTGVKIKPMASKSDGGDATTAQINKALLHDTDCDRVSGNFVLTESFNQTKDLFGIFQDYENCKSLLEGPVSSSAQCSHCFTEAALHSFSGYDTNVFIHFPSVGGSNIYGKCLYVYMHECVYTGTRGIMYVVMYVCMCLYVYAHVGMCVCMYMPHLKKSTRCISTSLHVMIFTKPNSPTLFLKIAKACLKDLSAVVHNVHIALQKLLCTPSLDTTPMYSFIFHL